MIENVTNFLLRHRQLNWVLLDQTMLSAINFVTGVLLARFMGIEEFGRYTLAWMVVLFVNTIHHAIIISPMMSIGPKQKEESRSAYFGILGAQQLIFSASAGVLIIVFVHAASIVFPAWEVEALALPLAGAAFFFQCQDFLRRYFFTIGHAKAAFLNDAVRYVGQLVLLIAVFEIVDLDTAGVLWVIVASIVISCIVGFPQFGARGWYREGFLDVAQEHWVFSRWLLGSAVMQWSSSALFTVVAGVMLGPMAVGALAASRRLMGVVHVIFMGLENFLPVRASWHFYHGRKPALFRFTKQAVLLGEVFVITIAVIAALIPEFWLRVVYGSEYAGHGYLLRVFALNAVILFVTMPLSAALRALNDTKAIFIAVVSASIFSIVTAYPAIYYLGIEGAAYGSVVVSTILVAVMFSRIRRA